VVRASEHIYTYRYIKRREDDDDDVSSAKPEWVGR